MNSSSRPAIMQKQRASFAAVGKCSNVSVGPTAPRPGPTFPIAVSAAVNPRYLDVLRTYSLPQGLQVDLLPEDAAGLTSEHACLAIQSPDYFGRIALKDKSLAETAHEAVERLRSWASGRCLDADRMGIYTRNPNTGAARPGRKVRRADPSNN